MLEEPDWDSLKDKAVVDQLFHINGHFDIVSKLEPKNIDNIKVKKFKSSIFKIKFNLIKIN
jgi:hypothetical protein